MKRHRARLATVLIPATVVLAIVGCAENNPVGNTDTGHSEPVTAESIGRIAINTMAQTTDGLSGTSALAGSATALLLAPSGFETTTPPPGLGKRSATSGESLDIDDSDPANPIAVYVVADTSVFGIITVDSVILRWDALAQDNIQDNENIISLSHSEVYPGGRIEYGTVHDLDGDGVVVGEAPYNGTARLFTYTKNGQTEEMMVLDAACGPDGDFENESDNKTLALGWVRVVAGDTVAYAVFDDADGDGYLVDHAATGESAVDVTLFEKNPAFAPHIAWSSLQLRVAVGSDGVERITKLSGTEKRRSGRVSAVVLEDSPDGSGDGVLDPGEWAYVTFATESSPATDPLASAQVKVVFDPASGLGNPEDNLYYELYAAEERRVGAIARQTFHFTTTDPVREGEQPTSGHVELTVTYRNGDTAALVADFGEGLLSGTYTGPDCRSVSMSWDENGTVVGEKDS
jgi:hypothetical protein